MINYSEVLPLDLRSLIRRNWFKFQSVFVFLFNWTRNFWANAPLRSTLAEKDGMGWSQNQTYFLQNIWSYSVETFNFAGSCKSKTFKSFRILQNLGVSVLRPEIKQKSDFRGTSPTTVPYSALWGYVSWCLWNVDLFLNLNTTRNTHFAGIPRC